MKLFRLATAFAVIFFAGLTVQALGPQECVLLVNRRSMASVELANFYADLRHIPAANIIHLDLPDQAREAEASFTAAEFNEYIRDPVNKIMRERNIAGHIILWLYSLDFPATITTTPPMSLTGITFTRGEVPPTDQIASGEWVSPLFAGPDRADGPASPSASLENFTLMLTNRMPVPSMLLGWSGSRGMSVGDIKQQLKSAAASDGALPSASSFFEINDDVRTQTRAWQFAPASRELAALGVAAFTASNAPADRSDLIGVLAGRSTIDAAAYGSLKPGSYADHLTSFAALFHDPQQSKLTEWLRRGAAGSSGTVTEPGSREIPVRLWAKFPSARLFAHYARGCTLAESLFLSTRCPLQILFVGDALCNPWAKPPGITLISMADDEDAPLKGSAEFLASSWGGFGQPPPTTIFFLDGRPVNHPGRNPNLQFDTTRLHDGHHELRVVAYANEQVRHQGSDMLLFSTRNRNRSATIGGYAPRQAVDLYRPLTFTINAEGEPKDAAIVVQERVIALMPYTSNMTMEIHPMLVGAGPVSFQAVAVYPDKMPVRSPPLVLDIQPLNRAPVIGDITVSTNSDQAQVVTFTASDEDYDPLTKVWYFDVLKETNTPRADHAERVQTLVAEPSGHLLFAATNPPVSAVVDIDEPSRVKEVLTVFRLGGASVNDQHHAGLVFNHIDENNFMVWGLDGNRSAWVLKRKRDGIEETIFSRGAPIDPREEYRLLAIAIGTQKMAFFVNDDLQGVADLSFGAGSIGVRNGTAGTRYQHLMISPPSAARSFFAERGEEITIAPDHADAITTIYAGARDVQRVTFKRVAEPIAAPGD